MELSSGSMELAPGSMKLPPGLEEAMVLVKCYGSCSHGRGADCGGKPCSGEHSGHWADKKQGNCPGFSGRCTQSGQEEDKEKGIMPRQGTFPRPRDDIPD